MDRERQYIHALQSISGINHGDKKYYYLINYLWKTEFYALLEMDNNRAADGLKIRETWFNQLDWLEDYGPCRMFEMIIGIAQRMDYAVSFGNENKTHEFFWEILNNLKLIDFDDDSFHDLDGEVHIPLILQTVLERNFNKNGTGGMFPLKDNHGKNQRKVEIYYQMSAYLIENYSLN